MRINVNRYPDITDGFDLTSGLVIGSLILANNPVNPLEASTKQYIDDSVNHIDANNLVSGMIPVGRLPVFTGDVSNVAQSGELYLNNTGIGAGTYSKINVNEKGRVTGSASLLGDDIPSLDWSKISSGKPTTLSGYGVGDAVAVSGGVMSGFLTVNANPYEPMHIATKSYVDMAVGATTGLVVGDIIRKPYSATPAGFLKCNGATVSKSTYMALYSVLSDTFTDYLSPNNGTPWQEQYYINQTQSADIVGWGTGVALPVTLASSHAVVTKNRVYLIGGKTAAGATSSAVYTAPINSDSTLGAWSTSSALPLAVSGSRAVVTKNRVFLLGGYDASGVKLASVLTAAVNSDGTLGAWANTKQLQTSALSGSGTMTIPSGVISVAITGKGGTGTTTYHPEVPYVAPTGNASYPSGLPVYNAGQAYIAPTGNASYPSGLPVYVEGVYYAAVSGSINTGSGTLSNLNPSGRATTLTVSMKGEDGVAPVSIVSATTGSFLASNGKVYGSDGNFAFNFPAGHTYVQIGSSGGSPAALTNTGNIYLYGTYSVYMPKIANSNYVAVTPGPNGSGHYRLTSDGKLYNDQGDLIYTYPAGNVYIGLSSSHATVTSWIAYTYNKKHIWTLEYGYQGVSDLPVSNLKATSMAASVFLLTNNTGVYVFNWGVFNVPTIEKTGANSTLTMLGTTYTFPGGVNGPATTTTKYITLTTKVSPTYVNSSAVTASYNVAAINIPQQGNASYPSGLPVYNAGKPYIAPTGNASYPSGLPVYNAGQAYVAAYNTYTTGAATTLTMNGQTYTFAGGYGGEAAQSTQTAALPGTSSVNATYSVASGGSCSLNFNIDGGIANIVGDLPSAIAQEQAVLTTNKLYTLGGVDTSAVYAATVNSDGTLAAWSTATSLPVATSAAALVVTSNRVYVAGGIISGNPSAAVHTAFINTDGTLGAWSAAASLPVAISNAQVMVSKKRVYLFGGKVGGVASSAVYTAPINADGTLGAWTTQSSLPATIYDSQAIVTANKVHLLGGVISNAYSSVTYNAPITGGLNDYSPYYDGSYTPTPSNVFDLPDTTVDDALYSNSYSYIKY